MRNTNTGYKNSLANLKINLHKLKNPEKAKFYPHFFKAGKGEYAEGDKFIGVSVPNCRRVAKNYKNLYFSDIENLLASGIHEERLVALLLLVNRYRGGSENIKKQIYNFYLNHLDRINNWDLVDLSAGRIVGEYLYHNPNNITVFKDNDFKGTQILDSLAKSDNLWGKRITVIATSQFICYGKLDTTLRISKILISDKHDLIHKAVGWMLREVGKKNIGILENFLIDYYPYMSRTTLRYAIERFPEKKRLAYLHGRV